MRKEYVVNLSGKDYPTYPGILDEAHERGLGGIEVEIVQFPSEENGFSAVARATVTMKDGGRFVDWGDASAKNTNSRIATALIRMASTRAKGRALRDAVNVGATMLEELPEEEAREAVRPQPERQGRPAARRQAREEPEPAPKEPQDAARAAYFAAWGEAGMNEMVEEIDAGTGYAKALARAVFADLAGRAIATRADATAEDFQEARRGLMRLKPDARRALVQGHYDALVAPPLAGLSPAADAALQAQSPNRAAQLAGH